MIGGVILAAFALCRHRHPLEWTASVPRNRPCSECIEHAEVCLQAGVVG